MTPPGGPHVEGSERPSPAPVRLRPARAGDVPALVPLLLRLKRLNEEFDPLLKVRDDAEAQAREILRQQIDLILDVRKAWQQVDTPSHRVPAATTEQSAASSESQSAKAAVASASGSGTSNWTA